LVFQRLVFRSRSPRFGFVRPVFFVCFPTTAHHEYIERKLDRLGDGLRRDRPWRWLDESAQLYQLSIAEVWGKDSIVNRAMRTLSPQAFESPTGKKKDRKPSQRKQGTVRLSKRIEKNTVKKCVRVVGKMMQDGICWSADRKTIRKFFLVDRRNTENRTVHAPEMTEIRYARN